MAASYYPAIVERAGKGYSVFFPDLPGCTSSGATLQDAARNAEEALAARTLGDGFGDPLVLADRYP